MMFLHADYLHRTERIKWRLEVLEIIGQSSELRRHKVVAWLFGLTVLSVEWFHICCYWMSTKRHRFWFRVSITVYYSHTAQFFFTPFIPSTVKRPTPFLTCTWFLHFQWKKSYFKYDACWTRCLNQIDENTNLHLLSVWRGFPYRNKGAGFPKT